MKILAQNKYALYSYEPLNNYSAGIVLNGWEVKSLKSGRVSLKESYIAMRGDRLFLIGANVSAWPGVKLTSIDQARDRELLLHKNEIFQVKNGLNVRGNTAVVLDIVLERNKIKVRFAVARGKKLYDKRSKLKEIDQKRDIERDLKQYNMVK